MKTPRYTDLAKYPRGYRKAVDTNIERTWADARKKLAEEQAKRAEVVREIKPLGQRKKA